MTPTAPAAFNRTLRLALLVAAVACLLCLWVAWCEFPVYSWNEARLAPAFALRHGINPYPPIGGGPLSTWIYGPVGIIVNLPATFAGSALDALHAASLINLAVLILPLALIFFTAQELAGRGRTVRWLALALAVLLIPRPNLVLQVADHVAVASGLLSCWWLARPERPSAINLIAAAAACAAAIWSKQITVFLVAAQVAYLFLIGERAAVVKYLLWLALFGGIALGAGVWAFGWANLWLNLVVIPGRLPWTGDLVARFAMRTWPLVAQIGLPSAGLLLLWFAKRWPRRESQSGRFFQLTVLAYGAMLPVGLAAYLKIGGDTNLLHSWDYLLPGALLAWLVAEKTHVPAQLRVAAVTVLVIALRWSDVVAVPSRPFADHIAAANQLMAAHPHRLWFPRNPIITFYADGELWHSEDGVETRYLANYGLREPDFRHHLPPHLEGVVYPSIVEFPFSMPLLSEFNQKISVPFWTLHTRAPATPAQP
jgi:hypothetical protein